MAYIANIFSGKTKTYQQDGVSFKTAIKKQLVTGTVQITKAGVEGNEIANHKNAIYAFNRDGYHYWREHSDLNVEWQAGLLGENLSIVGLDEKELCIGDLLHIGEVVLQVSGCRTPCGNLLWQLNAPESFLPTFQASGHSGFYLEVLNTGSIKAGDEIRVVSSEHKSISVADLALFFMERTPAIEKLQALLQIPGMGQQMLSMLTALLNSQKERELVFKNRWNGWQPFVISKIIDETSQIKSFYLKRDESESEVAGYKAGQYLTVKLNNESGEPIIRCWSISDYDETLRQYRISVKRESNGNGSKLIHDHYKVGDTVEIMPPMGQFNLIRNEIAVPVVLISAGVGITPMISMLKAHGHRLDKNLPTLHFIHSTQNSKTHAFKQEVSQYVNQFEMFHQHYIYTQHQSEDKLGVDFHYKTRLDEQILTQILADMGCWFAEKWVEIAPFECHYYLCGPDAFIQQTKTLLNKLSVPQEAIFDESFASVSSINYDKMSVEANVTFSSSKHKARWEPQKPQTLLELAENEGLTPAFSCRNGQCGLCSTSLLSGEVEYVLEPSMAVAKDKVLLCCSVPNGDVKLAL